MSKENQLLSKKNHNQEIQISQVFNRESIGVNLDKNPKPLTWTAKKHVEHTCGTESVIDVGSGSGRILLEMLKCGVKEGVGIDLAAEINEIARERMKKANIEENRFQILDGSFLEMHTINYPNILENYETISLHLVLCCHPDREGIIQQAISFRPKKIVITIPRTWILLRLFVGFWGLFTKLNGKFRPYIHSQNEIDTQLLSQDYELTERAKGKGLVVSIYELKKLI